MTRQPDRNAVLRDTGQPRIEGHRAAAEQVLCVSRCAPDEAAKPYGALEFVVIGSMKQLVNAAADLGRK